MNVTVWELHTIESLVVVIFMAHALGTVHVPAFLSPESWLGHLGMARRSFLKVACMRLARWYVVFGSSLD
jgi:hypothetical protein